MIELKDVTAKMHRGSAELKHFSLILRNGEVKYFARSEGELIINVILGFCPVAEGYVCFDGMPLDEFSVTFMRKLIAYIPSPETFANVKDLAAKQRDMLSEALQSDASIILAIDPFSHLSESEEEDLMVALGNKAMQGAIVVIATERTDFLE